MISPFATPVRVNIPLVSPSSRNVHNVTPFYTKLLTLHVTKLHFMHFPLPVYTNFLSCSPRLPCTPHSRRGTLLHARRRERPSFYHIFPIKSKTASGTPFIFRRPSKGRKEFFILPGECEGRVHSVFKDPVCKNFKNRKCSLPPRLPLQTAHLFRFLFKVNLPLSVPPALVPLSSTDSDIHPGIIQIN